MDRIAGCEKALTDLKLHFSCEYVAVKIVIVIKESSVLSFKNLSWICIFVR